MTVQQPKLWASKPTAILSMYGPTNMHTLPYLFRGRLSHLPLPPLTSEVLAVATNFNEPPTDVPVPKHSDDYVKPRGLMSMNIFRTSVIAEFLLKGLQKDDEDRLKLPERGCVSSEEIDEISKLALLFFRCQNRAGSQRQKMTSF